MESKIEKIKLELTTEEYNILFKMLIDTPMPWRIVNSLIQKLDAQVAQQIGGIDEGQDA